MVSGVLLALVSAAFFGIAAVCMRIGMRFRARDDGLFMSVLVNAVVLGSAAPFVTSARWDWSGVAAFIVAGAFATFLGRTVSFRAVRRIGASRANTFFISTPLVSGAVGWFVLGERITFLDAIGASVVFLGLGIMVRSRVVARSLVAGHQGNPGVASIAMGDAGGSVARLRRERLTTRLDASPRGGYAYALVTPFLFGLAFVARKWGLDRYSSPVSGAFLGVATALILIVVNAGLRGQIPLLFDQNFRRIPWWFVAGGAATSVALLLQFSAFVTQPAWLVSLLMGTQGLWTLFWSALFVRHDERITPELILSALLVMVGVGIVVVGL